MQHPTALRFLALAAALCVAAPAQQHKELGRMWTFENAPLEWFQQAYDFKPSPEWLDHARLSSLRMPTGCSASFVSAQGLIMTNNHCARGAVAKVQGEHDWVKDGFYAGAFENEVKLPELSVQQLVSTRDVTKEILGAADLDARQKEVVDKAKAAQPGLFHQVTCVYQDCMYQLYSYKVWSDLRLVCTPHLQIAHFGGDADNFCYPRYALDFTFLRAYENGKPVDSAGNYFRWKAAGPSEGDLVFVTGNPDMSCRRMPCAECDYLRDAFFPRRLEEAHKVLETMNAQARESPEKEKELRTEILGMENTRKAFQGYYDSLCNPRLMAIKRKAEAEIRARVNADPKLKEKYGDAWDRLAEVMKQAVGASEAQKKSLQEEEMRQGTRINEACFALYGLAMAPDADSLTLRISDGVVKGYPMNGTVAPWYTSLYGLYARHTEFGGVHPFDLPQPWLDKVKDLDLRTPVNFVATCDIVVGNSGSPVIDKDQNLVGLIFDLNIEMLGNMYVFDDETSRCVAVHPAFIVEALRKIYGAGQLADELEAKTTPARAKKEPAGSGKGG